VWAKANPNYGVSVDPEYLERQCRRAQETPGFENAFKRLHLNIRTEQASRWLRLERWDDCRKPMSLDQYRGKRCWGGLDIGGTSDLTSLCLVFHSLDGDGWDAWWWTWVPDVRIQIVERRKVASYFEWAQQGYMKATPGDEIDYACVRRDINDIAKRFDLQELAVDRLFQGAGLCQDLAKDGITIIAFGQGFYSMAAPTQEFERLVNRGEFHHDGNPLVRWCVSNAVVKQDEAGCLKPDKKRSKEKIDPVVSAIMALGRATVHETKVKPRIVVL